ncbi:MAG: hypothetical protein COB85_02780 [Bacteroidetes bacterium]|nr:MAG: hypothetical protein COB85_02780 [Bacteroidota bacterium]
MVRRISKILLLFLLMFGVIVSVAAQDSKANLDSANAAYSRGDIESSIVLYEAIIEEGYVAAQLFYNLGNAYYKVNEVASAILNFERAKKMDPVDEDIDYNLRLAKLRTVDKIESIPTFFINDITKDLSNKYSVDVWALIAGGSLWLSAILFAVYMISQTTALRKLFFWTSLLILVGGLVGIAMAHKKYDSVFQQREGIVFSPSIVVQSAPGDNGNDLFVLHEGTKVLVNEEIGDWSKIKLSDGSIGWLPASTIKII